MTRPDNLIVCGGGRGTERRVGRPPLATRTEVIAFVNNHHAGHAPESCRALSATLDSQRTL